jgi:hypothetical protein
MLIEQKCARSCRLLVLLSSQIFALVDEDDALTKLDHFTEKNKF